jgi:DNA-directed RNA polymerase I, II, and III subunit RPABC2
MSYSDDEEEVLELIKPMEIDEKSYGLPRSLGDFRNNDKEHSSKSFKIKMDLGEKDKKNDDDDEDDDEDDASDDEDSDLDSENSQKIRVKKPKDDDMSDDDISIDDDIESIDDLDDIKAKTKRAKLDKNELPNMDLPSDESGDDESESGDEEDENYLQKFDESIKQSIISDYHPELHQHNYEEVETLATVVRDELGIIIDPLHKTLPFLTKYEKARILGERAKQINAGGQPFIEVDVSTIDGYLIAMQELEQKKIPFILKRPLPNGGCEYWKLRDLEILI